METPQSQTRMLPLSSLVVSQTPMQIERRKDRTQAEISDLAETIARVGLIHAIVVRPDPLAEIRVSTDGSPIYEIVAGEGRYLAAQIAGFTEIQAVVRDLTDEQAEEVQIIENLQRKGLNEMVEALGYDALAKRGHTAEEIADKVGTSKATVYARLKLLALCPEARKALHDGKVSASIALLIARIPVADLQRKALEHILQPRAWTDEPMSYRDAADYVHREFMLRLSEAPFPCDNADLVPAAGTCGTCPKRTGNQPELFGDIKGADVCTDPKCFSAKRAAWNKLQVAKAKETGKPVITGAEAKKIHRRTTYGPNAPSLSGGYVRPNDKVPEDPKGRTYAELLGKGADGVLLQNPDSGAFSKAYKREDVATTLKEKHGITLKKETEGTNATHASGRNERDDKIAEAFRAKVLRAMFDAAPTKPRREDIVYVVSREIQSCDPRELFEALGWKDPGYSGLDKHIEKLTDSDLYRLLSVVRFAEDLGPYGEAKELLGAARKLKVDTKALHLQAIVETEPKGSTKAEQQPAPAKTKPKASKKRTAPRKAK